MIDSDNYSNNAKQFALFVALCIVFLFFYITIDAPTYDYRPLRPLGLTSLATFNSPDFELPRTNLQSANARRPLTVQDAPKILIWTGLYQDLTWENSVEKILPCGVFVTRQRKYLKEANIIIFHWRNVDVKDLPVKTDYQKWIWFHSESPHHTWKYNIMSSLAGKFDCWASYRRDSDFYIPYGVVVPKSEHNQTNQSSDFSVSVELSSKPKQVAWMVSNCKAPSGRDAYVKELSRHIDVDIYGSCGKLKCSFPSDFRSQKCWQKMADEYKFYLAFENSICSDYFTEKVVNVLKYNVIPVVFGGASYESVLPTRSFINALDYSSPEELSVYLKYLASNETAYNEYLQWKKDFNVELIIPDRYSDVFCSIYSGLTGPNPKTCQGTQGINLNRWWIGGGNCKKWEPGKGLTDLHVY